MPTYQYACTACDHRFEQVQKFTDPSLTECPECSGRLRKLYGSVGVVFKGSGFYRTDSRAKATADKGSADKGSGDKGSGDKPAGGEKSGGTPAKSASSGKSSSPASSTTSTAA